MKKRNSLFLLFIIALVIQPQPQALAKRKNPYQTKHNPYGQNEPESSALKRTGRYLGDMSKEIGSGLWKGVSWTGKSTYKAAEWTAKELFRPFVPARDKLIDSFGVEVKERNS